MIQNLASAINAPKYMPVHLNKSNNAQNILVLNKKRVLHLNVMLIVSLSTIKSQI